MSDIPDRPKVRQDLVYARQGESGGEVYIVKDPVSGRYFEIEEEEYSILGKLDGTRTPEEVLRSLEPDAGIDLGEIERFVRALDENCILESSRPAAVPGRFAKEFSIFHVRLKVINPKGIVDFLARHLGFLVSVPTLVILSGVVLFALWLTVSRPGVLTGGVGELKETVNIVLFYLIAAVMMTIHEFAHAVVCRRFKGEVREMGFMLLYFIPCFYTDVSDIYMMEKKTQRLAVIAAGPLVELALWGGFTIAYVYLPGGGILSNIFYVGMLTSGMKNILVNLNPMIRVDGYYFLEEVLGVRNLMEQARDRMRSCAGKWLGRSAGKKKIEEEEDGPTGRTGIVLVYGVLSFVYAAGLLAATSCAGANVLYKVIGRWSYAAGACTALVLLVLYGWKYWR